ncbi:MAG: LysM peptidoglycan-binding domain-containing protein [Chloroflexota bacterium]|nr:MAG: LysM peptidoglycan-binding domain-containing protein [Chloroflexota bacterium]
MPESGDNLVHARIFEVDSSGNDKNGVSVPCMFNPFEYTVSKSNSYEEASRNNSDVPQVEFKKAGAQTLRLSLTFDTYEADKDVSLETNKLWKLMESKTRQEGGRDTKVPPPEVAFEWGVFRFVAVITDMTQKFTLFKYNGTPVRAKVDITFTQHKDLNDYPSQNPTSGGGPIRRMRTVIAGDRLDTIAYEIYGDATKWRIIAEQNHITDPLHLRPGQLLSIPLD